MEPLPYVYLFGPACALILVLIWRDAKRAGYTPDRVAAAMAACATGAVIGSKVLMFDFHAAQYGEKTFLGAVVGGALTLAIVLKALQFDARAFDVPVLPVLWGHALGRVGCFVSGCCHGIEASVPWGVQYAWLPAPVHPTQLYESALDIVLALLLTRHRARFTRPASLALTGAAGIALVRFAVEPWRASAVPGPLGLSVVQATTLAVMIAAMATLVLRERLAITVAPRRIASEVQRSVCVLAGVVLVAFAARAWLTPLETLLVGAVLVSASAVVLYHVMPRIAVASSVVGLAVVAPMQSRDSVPPSLQPLSWHAIGTSVAFGGFEVTTEDCDGNTITRQDHSFKTLGISAETYRQERPGVGIGARFTGFAGLNTAPPATGRPSGQPASGSDAARHDNYSGATFAATVDSKWLGFKVGLAGGRWALRPDYPLFDARVPSQTMPIAGLRVGKLTGVHGAIDVGTHAPSLAPSPFVVVGMAKGDSTGNNLFRFGFTDIGPFVGGRVVSKDGIEFEPFVTLGNRYVFSVGLKKRFYRKP